MDRAVIHVGLHKTGTTGIQQTLESRIGWLRDRGVQYVPIDKMRTDVTPLLSDLSDWKRSASRQLFESVAAPTLILSDENIIGDTADLREGRFYPWARNRLEALFDGLREVKVELFMTLREPAELFPAMYSEYLRHNPFIVFDEYIGNFDLDTFSFWDRFGWLASAPNHVRVHILPFEADAGGGVSNVMNKIVAAALQTAEKVDLGVENGVRVPVRQSFSVEEIRLANVIASLAGGEAARGFLDNLDLFNGRFGTMRFRPIDPDRSARLSARYREDLGRFGQLRQS